jgi:hypothetical protein
VPVVSRRFSFKKKPSLSPRCSDSYLAAQSDRNNVADHLEKRIRELAIGSIVGITWTTGARNLSIQVEDCRRKVMGGPFQVVPVADCYCSQH